MRIRVLYLYIDNINSYIGMYGSSLDIFLKFSLPIISSYFTSWCYLLMKMLVEIIINSFESKENAINNWTYYMTYLVIVWFGICIILAEYFGEKGLIKYKIRYILSIYITLMISGSTFFNAIFFIEFHQMDNTHLIVYMCGYIINVTGVTISSFEIQEIFKIKTSKKSISKNVTGKREKTELLKTKSQQSTEDDGE